MELNKELSVASIVYSTSTDGVGLRNALYLAGCPLHCEDCHNKEWWDIESGSRKSMDEVFSALTSDSFNVSILGGEPLMQYDNVVELCKRIKSETDKTIWLWSGYTFEFIQSHYPLILLYIDVLVDGQFVKAKSLPNLKWRGSSNQRVIDVKSTLSLTNHTKKVKLLEG